MMSLRDFQSVIREAVKYFSQHGYTSESALDTWAQRIETAAKDLMLSPQQTSEQISAHLSAIYNRATRKIPAHLQQLQARTAVRMGPEMYFRRVATFPQLATKMRNELDRRIAASAELIKIRREESVAATLRRFRGWASSIPEGGTPAPQPKETSMLLKEFRKVRFETNRLNIDQGHKLNSALNATFAEGTGAIAAVWHSNWRQKNYNYRPDHKDRDERLYTIRNNWALTQGLMKVGPAGYTDEITAPAEEVNCLPGSVRIPFADGVMVGYRRWYSGELTEIITHTGETLQATPNHPILTPNGLVGIGSLKKGDYVIQIAKQCINSISEVRKNNHHHTPPLIAKIFSALDKTGRMEHRPGFCSQFHGDGSIESNVDIVWADRPLTFDFVSTLPQRIHQFFFAMANHACSSLGAFIQYFNSIFLSFAGSVSSNNSLLSLFWSHFAHGQVISNTDSCSDGLSLFRRISSPFKGSSFGFGANGDMMFFNRPVNMGAVNFQYGNDFIDGFPFKIKFDHIVSIKQQPWSGHVYNLQTDSGLYIADNFVVGNCRCHFEYVYSLSSLPAIMLTVKGQQALAALDVVVGEAAA